MDGTLELKSEHFYGRVETIKSPERIFWMMELFYILIVVVDTWNAFVNAHHKAHLNWWILFYELLWCSAGKESACNAGDTWDVGSIPESRRSLEEEMATHSSILAWRSPCTEEPGQLQSIGLQTVGDDLVTKQTDTHHTAHLNWWILCYIN